MLSKKGVLSIGEGCTTAKLTKRMQSQTFWAKKTCVYAVKHENVKQKGGVAKTTGLFTAFYHNNPSPMEREHNNSNKNSYMLHMISILISTAKLGLQSMLSIICNAWKALFNIESSMEFSIKISELSYEYSKAAC